MRRSERRFTLTTRSLRAPTSCFSSAVFSSLSLLQAAPSEPRVDRSLSSFESSGCGHVEIVALRGIRCLLEMEHRPLPAERGRAQSAVGIDGDRMSERGQKGGVVMRVGVTPAIRQIDVVRGGVLRAPDRLFVARHDGFGQPAGGAAAAEDKSVRGEVGDAQMARQRRDDEIRRSGDQHRLDPGRAIRLDQFDRARKKMADQDALAIFLAQRKQPVARDALERLEQDGSAGGGRAAPRGTSAGFAPRIRAGKRRARSIRRRWRA